MRVSVKLLRMKQEFSQKLDLLLEERPGKLAVAVSGGADSMALLHLAKSYADAHQIALAALTVDHGLRATSRAEAEQVGAWCKQNNIPHKILNWQGDKPQTGIQDTARNARRALLCKECAAQGIEFLLLGHQADDQAETILMRLQRGTGLRGLLGMREFATDDETEVVLLRPLLEMRRAALRDYCETNKIPFTDDPSNDDTQFERVRVRQALQALPDLANGVAQTVRRLAECDETLDMLAMEWLEEELEPIDAQTVWLPGEFLTELYPPVQMRILEGVMLEVLPDNATPHDIPLDGLERLRDALAKPNFGGQTLADVQFKPHKADGIPGFLISRAPARRKT